MKKKTIIITVNTNGYSELYETCITSQRKFALLHGYDFVNCIKPKYVLRNSFEVSSWSKVPLILSALLSGYERVVFLDGDCYINSECPPFESVFEQHQNFSIFGANGFSGRPNAGVMMYRNSQDSISFLTQMLRLNYFNFKVPDSDIVGAENTYFVFLMREHKGAKIIDRSWNKNCDDNTPTFIKHYSGPYKKLVPELESYSATNWNRIHRIRTFGRIFGFSNNKFNHNHGPKLMNMVKKIHKKHLENYSSFFDKKTFSTIWKSIEDEKKNKFELSKYP